MKTGLFFGSFNPVHIGHMVIAGYFSEFTDLDAVWMIVSPQNPLKQKPTLLQDYHRLALVKLAAGNNKKIKASDVEFKLSKPSYTINTVIHLVEKHPEHSFVLLLGEDNLETLHKWKNYNQLLDMVEVYVYPRPGIKPGQFHAHPSIKIVREAPLMQISSTFIRNAIAARKNVSYMLPESVWNYIDEMNFYSK